MPSPTTDKPASSTTSSAAAAADSTSTSTTTTTPASLETDLLTHLASTTALDDIHTNLLCYLQRMGWTEKIRTLSLELLRAGRCERFDEVVDAVMASAECRPHPAFDLSAANGTSHTKGSKNGTSGSGSNGTTGKNGTNATAANGTGLSADAEAYLENVDVRIPSVVVEHGVRMVKDVLKDVVSWEDGSSLDEGLEQSAGGTGAGAGAGGSGSGQAASSKTGGSGASGNNTSGKKLDKDKDDAGDSSTSKKNSDGTSPVKKTAKKSHPGKTGK